MDKTKTIVWQRLDNPGLEYFQLTESDDGILADGIVIGADDNQVFYQLHYQVRCDAHYRVQRVDLDLAGYERITLTADGQGHWFFTDNQPLHEFNDYIDIDISATPFTNTLPIRRLDWQPGQSRSLDMIYIRIPELRFERVTQQYTCLEQTADGRRFEYTQPGFSAILSIDADGFVQNYPKLFRRLS
jgi:hypothetical protein